MVALGAGPIASSPATAARARLALQVDGGVMPDWDVPMAWAVFMFPLVKMPRLVAPRVVSPAVVVPWCTKTVQPQPAVDPRPAGAVSPVALAADPKAAPAGRSR